MNQYVDENSTSTLKDKKKSRKEEYEEKGDQ
jgi:hypothetical protein